MSSYQRLDTKLLGRTQLEIDVVLSIDQFILGIDAALSRSDVRRELDLDAHQSVHGLIRIGALELAQQPVAAGDRGIQGFLRGFLAAERLLQFLVDDVADQHEGSQPQAF
jgi:hypothetical protein